MSREERDAARLRHILDHIGRATEYVASGRAAFDRETMRQDAVIRCLTVIGEAAGALSEETRRRLPSLPPQQARGQRNLLVHEYWRVDPDIVWATVTVALPPLAAEIRSLLAE